MARCVIDLPQDQLQRTVRRERPKSHAFVERVSELQLFCGSNEAREELVKHRFDNDESLCADACLSVVSEPSENGHGHGMVEVGVVEDNECIASTQLHGGLLEVLASPGRQGLSCTLRTGEGNRL